MALPEDFGEVNYNPRTGRYHSEHGGFLSSFDLDSIIKEESTQLERKLLRAADRFLAGSITEDDWQRIFVKEIKHSHIRSMTIGAGGDKMLTQNPFSSEYFQRTQDDISDIAYRSQFVLENLRDGERTPGQFKGWIKQQATTPYRTFARAELLTRMSVQGANEAIRLLDPVANHCRQCPGYSTNGKAVPIEEVVPLGVACDCGGYCRCRIRYRFNPELALTGGTVQDLVLASRNAA